jgi:syntaxin 1B/2/3
MPLLTSEMMDKIQERNKTVKETLKGIDQETKKLKEKKENIQEVSIRESQYAVALQKFCQVVTEYKQAQEEHQAKVKERLVKHVLVVNPQASKEDIDRVMAGEKVFAPQNAQQRAEAKAALGEISKKHRDVAKLTESILELQQLFVDITVLLHSQGNQISL